MLKLSKAQLKEKADWIAKLSEKQDALTAAVDAVNETLARLRTNLEQSQNELSEVLAHANDWRQSIADDMDAYFNDRSEKWQEGDKGESYRGWMEQWEAELTCEEVVFPDDLEQTDCEVAETLDQMPDEVDSI